MGLLVRRGSLDCLLVCFPLLFKQEGHRLDYRFRCPTFWRRSRRMCAQTVYATGASDPILLHLK
jgi:hypothetical protein